MDMRPWIPIADDPVRLAEVRQKFTAARRGDYATYRRVWVDCDPGEAWAKLTEYGAGARISLSADWDKAQISDFYDNDRATIYEISRPPVTVLTLSAWIGEDGIVTEEPEQTSTAWWSQAFTGDLDRMLTRAAHWITSVPRTDDPHNYLRSHRFSEAQEIALRRLKKWSYDRLETAGVALRWHVEDHRINWHNGAYRTLVKLSGSDVDAVREEWIGGLPRKRRELLADDTFRRNINAKTGKPVDMDAIKAGPSLPETMCRAMATRTAPKPSEAMFRISSWVDWTCPDTGIIRRGVVIEERLSKSLPVGITVLPDDGGEPVDVLVSGTKGKLVARLGGCGKIKKGAPGTVTVAEVPSLDEVEWKPEPEPAAPEQVPAALDGEQIDLFALFMPGPATA